MAGVAAVASILRKRWPRYALRTAVAACYAVMLLPIFFVCWLSFFKNEILSFPPEGYTLRWFKALWLQPQFAGGFVTSLEVGLLAMLGGLAVGIPASLALVRSELPLRQTLNTLLLSPLVVPGIVIGTSLYFFLIDAEIATDWPLTGSMAGLVFGHILITIPWTVRLIAANLVGVDRAIEEAAMNLGADRLRTLLKVTLPVIRPGVVAAALFSFVVSFGNLELSLFLVSPGETTLPIAILQYLEWKIDPTIAAVSLIQIAIIAGAMVLTNRFVRLSQVVLIAMSSVALQSVSKSYGGHRAVSDFTLEIAEGEFTVLLGPSGCGKTTTLRMIAGFVEPTSGRILFGDRDVTELPPYHRNTGLVFQGYALFPHLSVFENVAFGLRMRKLDRAAIERRAREALRLVRLEGLGERMPRQLSGGQQQRVALARALAIEPEILLLDEPLSSLDAKLREEVRVEIRQLQRRLGLTTVMVTHDQEEALSVADRLVVMRDGEIQQIGTQRELYNAPANQFVAGFIGRTNFFAGAMAGPRRFRTSSGLEIAVAAADAPDCLLAIRPERVRLGNTTGTVNSFAGTIEFVSYLGANTEYVIRLASGDAVMVEIHNDHVETTEPLTVGAHTNISWDADACQLIT